MKTKRNEIYPHTDIAKIVYILLGNQAHSSQKVEEDDRLKF